MTNFKSAAPPSKSINQLVRETVQLTAAFEVRVKGKTNQKTNSIYFVQSCQKGRTI